MIERHRLLQQISTIEAAQPLGHYAQAQRHNGLLYVSGLLPIPADGTLDSGNDFECQAELVLKNARAILTAGDSSFAEVVKTTVYVTDISNWGTFDRLYSAELGSHRPARAVVPVPVLHHGFSIELEMIATTKSDN